MGTTFGQNLRAARHAAGLSQKQLAELIGAKHNSVSNWENGVNSPSQSVIETLCRVLGVRPDHLFGTCDESDEFTYALFDEAKALTPENQQKLLEMARFFRQQQAEGR